MPTSLNILYEDNHLLAIDKPAGWATMGVDPSRPSLVHRSKSYLKQKYDKPGNVYLGVVSRLDSVTTGVVVFARTSKAAARLSKLFRERQVDKTYLAVVSGHVPASGGSWVDWMVKDDAAKKMKVVPSQRADAKDSRLTYRRLKSLKDHSVVEIKLDTGRKHQIRVQAASRGHPILGDRKYGSDQKFPAGIALHAWRVEFDHPVQQRRLIITAAPPKSWRTYLASSELE